MLRLTDVSNGINIKSRNFVEFLEAGNAVVVARLVLAVVVHFETRAICCCGEYSCVQGC